MILLAALVLAAGSAGAFEVECSGPEPWHGDDVRDCPCCEVCDDGSWHIVGERTCREDLASEPPPASPTPYREPKYGGTTKQGFAACISEDLFRQWVAAAVKRDKPGMAHLLAQGCIRLRGGLGASILDRSWTGTVKARLYLEDESTVFWTYKEAIAN
jgi:hypothetical protein